MLVLAYHSSCNHRRRYRFWGNCWRRRSPSWLL